MFKRYKYSKKTNLKNYELGILDKRTSFWKPFLLLTPAIIILLTFIIIPFITTSSHAFEYLPNKHDKTETAIGIKMWTRVFEDPHFINGIQNSMLYTFISVPIVLVLSAIISSAIANVVRKWLRGIFQTIFFLPYVTSIVAIALAFAYIFDLDIGLLNNILGKRIPWLIDDSGASALWAMLIYGIWRGLAFNILIFTTAMLGVDKTLYKSASIDGAGKLKQFFAITLPSITKTTNFLLTIGIIGAIKVFPLALFNNNAGNAMSYGASTLLLYVFNTVQIGNIQKAAVSSIVLVLISISFSIVFRQGLRLLFKLASHIGDKHVSNKIKIKKTTW